MSDKEKKKNNFEDDTFVALNDEVEIVTLPYNQNPTQMTKPFETIKIKYHNPKLEKIVEGKGDWFDLRAAEYVKLKKGEFTLINLGVSMKLPAGYEAHIVPRSSTFKNWGIIQTNHMGVVDNSYSGSNDIWRMPVFAVRDTEIEFNDRICQFRIMKTQPYIYFDIVDELDEEDRGGFGSTGKK